MEPNRIDIIASSARRPQRVRFRVHDSRGRWLRSFRYVEDALEYCRLTDAARAVVRIGDDAPITSHKAQPLSEARIASVIARASRAEDMIAACEALPDPGVDPGADDGEEEGDAA